MFGLSAKERALKKYQEKQRQLRSDPKFTCKTSDSDFLLWYLALSSSQDASHYSSLSSDSSSVSFGASSSSSGSSCQPDSGNSYSTSCDTPSSTSFDSGSSW